METPHPASLTPEQLAAIHEGGGCARFEDPSTHRVYVIIEQPEGSVINDQYVRAKIEEAYARGDAFEPLDIDGIKTELLRRLAVKKAVSH